MKKLIVGLVAIASFVFSANAQEARKMKPHQSRHDKGLMMQQLNLSAAQKEQIKANKASLKQQMAELEKDENITVKEYKARKAAILQSQKTAMQQVLTAEQKTQLANTKRDQKEMHQRHGAKNLDKMKADLNLSDEQVAKMKANRAAAHEKMMAIKENKQLSEVQKKEQLMAVKQAQKSDLKQVLTAEQISKLEEKRKSRVDKTSKK